MEFPAVLGVFLIFGVPIRGTQICQKIVKKLKICLEIGVLKFSTNSRQIWVPLIGTPKNNCRDKSLTNLGFGAILNAVMGPEGSQVQQFFQNLLDGIKSFQTDSSNLCCKKSKARKVLERMLNSRQGLSGNKISKFIEIISRNIFQICYNFVGHTPSTQGCQNGASGKRSSCLGDTRHFHRFSGVRGAKSLVLGGRMHYQRFRRLSSNFCFRQGTKIPFSKTTVSTTLNRKRKRHININFLLWSGSG